MTAVADFVSSGIWGSQKMRCRSLAGAPVNVAEMRHMCLIVRDDVFVTSHRSDHEIDMIIAVIRSRAACRTNIPVLLAADRDTRPAALFEKLAELERNEGF